MEGKIVVITGASDGIGAAAARSLARRGATVVAVGRSSDKTARVAAELGTPPFVADFSELDSVRHLAAELCEQYPKIDVLADNAGGIWPRREITGDGHELTFQINQLAPFLLTNLLRGPLAASQGRVIVTSSAAHRTGHIRLDDLDSSRWYLASSVYGTTKLENVLFAAEIARRWASDGVRAASFHPGVVATQFGRDVTLVRAAYQSVTRRLMRTPEQGAETLTWLATAPEQDWRNGGYHADRGVARLVGQAASVRLASDLWERCAEMVDLDG